MKRGKLLALAGVVLFTTLVVATTSQSISNGIVRPTLTEEGCICHSGDGHGKPNGNVSVYLHIAGNPAVYEPNKVYNLTFGAASTDVPAAEGTNKGGFNLKVSAGALQVPPGWEEFLQVSPSGAEGTHLKKGDVEKGRNWSLLWKAPAADEGPAVFTLWINTVDGSGSPDAGDHFNTATFVVLGKLGTQLGAGGGIDPEHIGVNWLAHWVGIASFLAVAGTLLIYYFVLKYGESIHTTDHRDRKEK